MRSVYSSFWDSFNIWVADLVNTRFISKCIKKEFDFYYVLLIYLANMRGLFNYVQDMLPVVQGCSRYVAITKALRKFLDDFGRNVLQ